MSKVNVTSSEFCDLIIAFFLDKCLHPDEVVFENKNFDKFMLKMAGKGIKSVLLQYYLSMSSETRVKYKRLRKTLTEAASEGTIINVKSVGKDIESEPEKKKEGMLRKIIRKLITKEDLDIKEMDMIKEVVGDKGGN